MVMSLVWVMSTEFVIASTEDDFVQKSTQLIAQRINTAIDTTGSCIIALSGGSTPRPIYRMLAKIPIDWDMVEVLLVDERVVPYKSEKSNARMIEESLGLPVHRMGVEGDPKESALSYEQLLKDLFEKYGKDRLDVVVLGMGADGHSASIFPDIPNFESYIESIEGRLVVSHYVPSQDMVRLTMTPSVLSDAAESILLITGEEKGRTFAKALNSWDANRFPVLLCTPERFIAVLDRAAYAQLKY